MGTNGTAAPRHLPPVRPRPVDTVPEGRWAEPVESPLAAATRALWRGDPADVRRCRELVQQERTVVRALRCAADSYAPGDPWAARAAATLAERHEEQVRAAEAAMAFIATVPAPPPEPPRWPALLARALIVAGVAALVTLVVAVRFL